MPQDWFERAVVYGIDVSRFRDSDGDGVGDLRGVVERLDHLQGLGVTCLWLLPFYPSDRQDNGYDVTNYLAVDPRLGHVEDFLLLTREAHARGMHVMIDLVLHHTSDRHPWFEAAAADPGSRYRDYYVWSEERPEDSPELSSFPQEEDGVWRFSETAGAYYRHQFYSFQPDLRIANDGLWEQLKGIVDFWIALGADGFRIDAATHLFEDKGIEGAQADLESRLDDLRAFVDERDPHVVLLGEANVPPEEIAPFFEAGRFDLLYNFLLNAALFLSLARGSAEPLTERFRELHALKERGAWLNFVRNTDELELSHLTEDEREEVFAVFAPDPDQRIYSRGIRRAWAPMMRSEQELRMTMSLLFALPGVPLLMAGQEIGMGEDLSIEGRSSVRLPMQWSAGPAGGFSEAGEGELVDLATPDGEHGYLRVNVADQDGRPDSLLAFVRRLAALRREHPELGTMPCELTVGPSPAVSLVRYGTLHLLHNLSAQEQPVPEYAGDAFELLLGDDAGSGVLPGHGFCWLEERRGR